MKFIDLTGQRFGRLTVTKRVESSDKNSRWHCKCDCGNERDITRNGLVVRHTQSCGCYHKEVMADIIRKRCTTHGLTKTRLYSIWGNMKNRCYYLKDIGYKNYGGRGITICDEWLNNFQVFYDWAITNNYNDNLSIDRINNDLGYFPDNCKWADKSTQANNRRSNRVFSYLGKTQNLKQWADEYGFNYSALQNRITDLKMPIDEALTKPLRR